MSKFKLVVSDMDNTFLDPYGIASDINLEVFNKLREKGIVTVIATGRNLSLINEKVRNCCDYFITSNGAAAYKNDNGKITKIYSKSISKERARDYLNDIMPLMKGYQLLYEDKMYSSDHESFVEFIHRSDDKVKDGLDPMLCNCIFQKICKLDNDYLKNINSNNDVHKIDLSFDEKNLDKILERTKKYKDINTVYCSTGYIESMALNVGKGLGINEICKTLNIKTFEVLTFGDAGNDLDMKRIGCKLVAVKNAEKFVQDGADEVCGSNENSGVGRYILEHISEF